MAAGRIVRFRLHHPALQNVRGIAGLRLHGLLLQDAAAVADFVHEMHGGTGATFHALGKLVITRRPEALAGEAGTEAGMHISGCAPR